MKAAVVVNKVWIFLLVVFSSCLLATARPGKSPQLFVDPSVAPDFAALIQTTWTQFLAVFDARKACFGDVRITAVATLPDRAQYDPTTATVTVRVPARGSALKVALVHEWAHHLEFQCAAQTELRPAFLVAQGLSPNTPWSAVAGSTNLPAYRWATIPSEQFAETVAVLVLNRHNLRTPVPVTEDGIRIITTWARGETLP